MLSVHHIILSSFSNWVKICKGSLLLKQIILLERWLWQKKYCSWVKPWFHIYFSFEPSLEYLKLRNSVKLCSTAIHRLRHGCSQDLDKVGQSVASTSAASSASMSALIQQPPSPLRHRHLPLQTWRGKSIPLVFNFGLGKTTVKVNSHSASFSLIKMCVNLSS